ncbi:MAG: alkyl hydroperoxide reductase/Thiol specific antioxidant/Mal allergen [Chloroflexi bacterium]|nr:alkyl hydroperoxide reductase/Thiol specific antioxidant/Mal allergen [Chloroflexota bacterium]
MEAEYNVADFRRPEPSDPIGSLARADIQPALRVGAPAPDFDLASVDGGRVRLHDVLRERHAVLIFGAITSPVTATNLPELNRLWEYYKWRDVQFLFIYVREPHPGEVYPHHTSMDQKIAVAKELQRLEEIRFPVLVDELDGQVHRAYGPRPNPIAVVSRNGRLMYRAGHAESGPLADYLEHLLLWDQVEAQGLPTHNMYVEAIRFIIPDGPLHKKIVQRAGPKAVREMQGSFGESSHLT